MWAKKLKVRKIKWMNWTKGKIIHFESNELARKAWEDLERLEQRRWNKQQKEAKTSQELTYIK